MTCLAWIHLLFPHLHALPREYALFNFQIDFRSWSFDQSAGAHQNQQHQAH
jgi:hypothetical protein